MSSSDIYSISLLCICPCPTPPCFISLSTPLSPLRPSPISGPDGEIVAVRIGLSIDGPRRLDVELVGQNALGNGEVTQRIAVDDFHAVHCFVRGLDGTGIIKNQR